MRNLFVRPTAYPNIRVPRDPLSKCMSVPLGSQHRKERKPIRNSIGCLHSIPRVIGPRSILFCAEGNGSCLAET